jgi:hypothetical protein
MISISPAQDRFLAGVLCGMLLMLGAEGARWVITPFSHSDASTALSLGVAAQVILSNGAAVWLWYRARRRLESGHATSP